MSRFSAVALLILLESVGGDRNVVATISVSNGGTFGQWRNAEFCPRTTYAVGYHIKVEGAQGSSDDTGLNGIELICANNDGRGFGVGATSDVGPWGDWNNPTYCPRIGGQAQFMVQFMLRVEPAQGSSGDDTAANDVEFTCNFFNTRTSPNYIRAPGGMGWGDWSHPRSNICPDNSAICGISTKVESPQGDDDDTSLNDVKLFCCSD